MRHLRPLAVALLAGFVSLQGAGLARAATVGAAHRFGVLGPSAGLVPSFVVIGRFVWQRLASRSPSTAGWCARGRLWCLDWWGWCW